MVVIDGDLDAPGVGSLLAADTDGTTAGWGLADYLLETPVGEVDLRDYYHACRRESVTGSGEILVIPAGRVNEAYLGKLARLDLEPPPPGQDAHPLRTLLEDVRRELEPSWILLDARSGLADPAGLFLQGLAHLNVLFGTFSEQSWQGIRLLLRRLGADRIEQNRPQADCLLVHAMVPRDTNLFRQATEAFAERALDEFTDYFYAADEAGREAEGLWTVSDAQGSDAPHVPVPLPYEVRLAHFNVIDDVADLLHDAQDYRNLAGRIRSRFGGGG